MRAYTDWMVETLTEEDWAATAAQDGELQQLIDYADALEAEQDVLIDALFGPVDDEPVAEWDLFDYDAELEDLEGDMLDREFWARGMW